MRSITPIQNLEVEMRILDIDTTALLAELTRLGATPSPERLLVTTWIQDPQGGEYRLRQDGDTLRLEHKMKQSHSSRDHISISEEKSIILETYTFSDILTLASTLGYKVITSNTKTRTAHILSLEEGSVEIALDTYDTIDGTTIPPYIEIEALSLKDREKITPNTLDTATALVHRVANILGYKKEDHSMMNVRKMTEYYKKIQADEQRKLETEIEAEYRKATAGMNEHEIKIYNRNKSIADTKKFGSLGLNLTSIQNDIRFIIENHLSSKLLAPRKQAHYERLSNTLYKDQFIMHDAIAQRHPFSGHITKKESLWIESIAIKYKAHIASLGYTILGYEKLDDAVKGVICDTFIKREWGSYQIHPFQTQINSGLPRKTQDIEQFLFTEI